ncbi:rhamnogalacturonan lyase [Xylanimonas protaetiae]|uniref:Rhamnogalacturonan lyase n=1 Tax=Xylanimonas protaetiae TaxID=2509457 RepID=A0A4P6F4J9_9MICO|nr:rhamnogalacturonan lyase [Xylanimonas protaetiae]QAY70235.1 rhamnogalacturonan lyase [Xylanimonas protaetiae]
MRFHRTAALTAATASALALAAAGATTAGAAPGGHPGPRPAGVQLEALDRGLVAASTDAGVFLSWRLLGTEVTGHTATGVAGADFAVYRDGVRVATVTDSTNYLDADGSAASSYQVAPIARVDNGQGVGSSRKVEGAKSAAVTPWASGSLDIPLNKPADDVTPVGEAYSYSANDASVADLDGDGTYEIVVKWDPSNSKDVSQRGYTGHQILDAYELDGTQLWRIDLGVNIRAGAHYTQFPVYDLDGDGAAELMVKTAPGTSVTPYHDGVAGETRYVTLPADDVAAGVTNADDYRLSAAGYYEHVVAMFKGWSTRPEVVSGQWPATLEQAFGIAPQYSYPLSDADARALTDYFMDVYALQRSVNNKLHEFAGFVVDGPEYLTVFEGATGRELQTVDYKPGRTDDGLLWGDYAMARIEPANRVDRFLSGVAYLDGKHPSAVFARGYYTRTTVIAYDWDGTRLHERWYVDSGWTPMTNPFNDSPHGRDGTDPEYGTITTQGYHSISAADVDGDGRQEIVYGSATLDDDGSLLYSSFDTLPPGSAAPGTEARLGHGDAMHVTDILPDRPGLEIFNVHEGATGAPFGTSLRDAATGETLQGVYSGRDTGRGMIGDVRPDVPGIEMWSSMPGGTEASGLLDSDWNILSAATPGTNQSVRWAGDGTTQVLNGSGTQTPTIDDWATGAQTVLTGTLANNGTKGNASLVADILGDWREEVLLRTADSSALRLYLSTDVTSHKLYTLMHDPQYRAEVARQQTVYNQPSYPGFYLASDTDWSTVPIPVLDLPGRGRN